MPQKAKKPAKTKASAKPGKAPRAAKTGRSTKAAGSAKPEKQSSSGGETFGFAGPLIGDLIAGALLAGADALTGGKGGKGKGSAGSGEQGRAKAGDQPPRAPLEGEVEPARAGAAGVGMADLAGYAMAIAVGEIAGKFVAAYERQMGNGPIVRKAAGGAKIAADVAWKAFDKDS